MCSESHGITASDIKNTLLQILQYVSHYWYKKRNCLRTTINKSWTQNCYEHLTTYDLNNVPMIPFIFS